MPVDDRGELTSHEVIGTGPVDFFTCRCAQSLKYVRMRRTPPARATIRVPTALTFLIVTAALYFAREVLAPLALAAMVTFLLAPSVRRLERLRFPRVAAVLTVVSLSTLFVGAVGWIVERQVEELAQKLPEYKSNILDKVKSLRPSVSGSLSRAGNLYEELGLELSKPAANQPGSPESAPTAISPSAPLPVKLVNEPTPPLTYLRNLLGPVLSRVATAGVVIVFATFMLIYREDLRSRLIMLIGEQAIHVTTPALDEAGQRVSRYLVMQSLSNAIAGATIGLGMMALGIPNAALWGLVIAILRFVPYIGVWIAAALPLTLSLALSSGWTQPLSVLGLIVVVELVLANFVEPLMFSSGTGLSPIAVLASAVFWAWIWGPVGLLLSTPMAVCLAILGRHVPRLRYLEILLGGSPVLTPPAQLYQRMLAGDQDESLKLLESAVKENPVAGVDTVILPSIQICEAQRDAGNIDDVQETVVLDIIGSFAEDLAGRIRQRDTTQSSDLKTESPGSVICIPASDRADELSAKLLEQVLTARGIACRTLSADSMMGEILEQVATLQPAAVCICAVPPGSIVHARVLCKRLRSRCESLPIVVGIWQPEQDIQQLRLAFGTDSTDHIVSTVDAAAAKLAALSSTVSEGTDFCHE